MSVFFFFNDTATTEIYTLSLHDALPICLVAEQRAEGLALVDEGGLLTDLAMPSEGTDAHVTLLAAEYLASHTRQRSEEHTSELQSLRHLVCRLLLEKKKHNRRHDPVLRS